MKSNIVNTINYLNNCCNQQFDLTVFLSWLSGVNSAYLRVSGVKITFNEFKNVTLLDIKQWMKEKVNDEWDILNYKYSNLVELFSTIEIADLLLENIREHYLINRVGHFIRLQIKKVIDDLSSDDLLYIQKWITNKSIVKE